MPFFDLKFPGALHGSRAGFERHRELLPGDFVRMINDKPTRDMSVFEGTRLLHGAPGTKVTITGARLTGAQVTIGGKSAKQLSSGATKLVIVTPAGTIGVHGAVAVKTIGGSVSSGTFTWVR